MTITGSIGVIGGWLWDDGAAESAGITSDEELVRVEAVITCNYDEFVQAVANGLCDRLDTLDEAIERAKELAEIPDWRDVRIVEYPPRRAFSMPNLLPPMPSLMGIVANGEEDQAAATASAELASQRIRLQQLGLTFSELDYLTTIGGAPGRPLFMISPDVLPQDWARDFLIE